MKTTMAVAWTVAIALVLGVGARADVYRAEDGKLIVDKGDFGKYWHDGKLLRRMLSENLTVSPSSTDHETWLENAEARGVLIDKGDLGVYVRDGKFVRRLNTSKGAKRKHARSNPRPEKKPTVIHEHGPGGKFHRNRPANKN